VTTPATAPDRATPKPRRDDFLPNIAQRGDALALLQPAVRETACVTTSVITDQLITGQRGLIHQGREGVRAKRKKRKMDEGNGFADTSYLILKLHSVGDQAKHDQASGRTPLRSISEV
jgi:hypothetical protein